MNNRSRNGNPIKIILASITAAAVLAGTGTYFLVSESAKHREPQKTYIPAAQVSVTASPERLAELTEPALPVTETEEVPQEEHDRPFKSENTKEFSADEVTAYNSILIDADTMEILGRHNSIQKIYPASMTKVMTLLVAAENLTESDMDKTYTMTYELLHPLVVENASRVGFEVDETVTVRDMLYGLILPSGGDAAVGLAEYIAGSEEAYAELMNKKAEELGLKETHFMNVSGLHDADHYTTCGEMAMIMRAAMQNDICREILSTYTYTTSQTEQHPEGIVIYSTMFGRMYGNEVEGVSIIAGKTGYTDEARHCLVSYAEKGDRNYICVLAGEDDRWAAVYSTFNAYGEYLP